MQKAVKPQDDGQQRQQPDAQHHGHHKQDEKGQHQADALAVQAEIHLARAGHQREAKRPKTVFLIIHVRYLQNYRRSRRVLG